MSKQVFTVCLRCGQKYSKKNKSTFGVWKSDCDICGEKDVFCADAQHDFGIYNNPEEKKRDQVQD